MRLIKLRFFLLNGNLAAIVTTCGANSVVDVEFATVGANSKCGCYCLVMSSALESACLGLSSFRMCHDDLLFNDLQLTI